MPPSAYYILISLRQQTYPLKLPLYRYLTLWIFFICLLLLEKTCKTVVHISPFFLNYHCLFYHLWVNVCVCVRVCPCYWKTQKIGLLLISISATVSTKVHGCLILKQWVISSWPKVLLPSTTSPLSYPRKWKVLPIHSWKWITLIFTLLLALPILESPSLHRLPAIQIQVYFPKWFYY